MINKKIKIILYFYYLLFQFILKKFDLIIFFFTINVFMTCSICGRVGHNRRTCSWRPLDIDVSCLCEHKPFNRIMLIQSATTIQSAMRSWFSRLKANRVHSSAWKFLNASDPWSSVQFLLDYYDVPYECQKNIVSMSLPSKLPQCPSVIRMLRVHNTPHIQINSEYLHELGKSMDDELYYDVAKTLYTPPPPDTKIKFFSKKHGLLSYKLYFNTLKLGEVGSYIYLQNDILKLDMYYEKEYLIKERFSKGKIMIKWYTGLPVPADMRKEEFWPEFRHYIHMCELNRHQKFSTIEMYTNYVEKYGSREHLKAAKQCEHVRLYKNVGGWRKNELSRAYPTLYGKNGWVKKL